MLSGLRHCRSPSVHFVTEKRFQISNRVPADLAAPNCRSNGQPRYMPHQRFLWQSLQLKRSLEKMMEKVLKNAYGPEHPPLPFWTASNTLCLQSRCVFLQLSLNLVMTSHRPRQYAIPQSSNWSSGCETAPTSWSIAPYIKLLFQDSDPHVCIQMLTFTRLGKGLFFMSYETLHLESPHQPIPHASCMFVIILDAMSAILIGHRPSIVAVSLMTFPDADGGTEWLLPLHYNELDAPVTRHEGLAVSRLEAPFFAAREYIRFIR
ncbi:hypothetical protein C8J56DRAFT_1126447 [Mycena floridula]|nr:hypothetical protein C8J56DRAFT_1126447 [Mycena floridula]